MAAEVKYARKDNGANFFRQKPDCPSTEARGAPAKLANPNSLTRGRCCYAIYFV